MIDFFTGIFSSPYYAGVFLNLFSLMVFSALGNCISLKAGFYNLGGDGQIYLGGFIAALCLSRFSFLPAALNFIFSFCIASCVCGLFCVCSAVCSDLKKVSVLLTSYLFSSALIPVLDFFISGKFRTEEGNLLATDFIPEKVRLASLLPPSPLNASIFLIPVLCFLFWFIFNRTNYGTEIAVWGCGSEFAVYSGLSQKKILYSTLFIDGALHGVTGFFAVAGQYFTCHVGFASGLGWNSFTCALLANKNPLAVIPAGLFLAWIFSSAERFSLLNNFGANISGIIQGVILFFIAADFFGTGFLKKMKCGIKSILQKSCGRKK